ncbi:MAG: hypothetical protein JW863_00820 [Chitinispirillaceae bacterium]|nr:hypothetical protein [Chitinispirillaceae bacterium]
MVFLKKHLLEIVTERGGQISRRFLTLVIHTLPFVFLICCTVLADAEKVGDHNIGMGAGFITGYGLSYRHWFNRFGFQFTTSPYYTTDDYFTETTTSVGATALAKIKESRFVNLIAYLGPHYFYHDYSYKNSLGNEPPVENLFIGGGPGLDFHFLNLSLSLMFGYCFRYQFADDHFGTNFSGECGLYYSF